MSNLRAKIAKLERLANHPGTPHHEAESAREAIKKLRAKLPATPPQPKVVVFRTSATGTNSTFRWQQYSSGGSDPFDEALRRDGRTPAQKNQDMQDRLRNAEAEEMLRRHEAERNRAEQRAKVLRCSEPEAFYTSGGYPRPRNQFPIECDRCGVKLAKGEGTILTVGGVTYGRCCEAKPGPRKRRF